MSHSGTAALARALRSLQASGADRVFTWRWRTKLPIGFPAHELQARDALPLSGCDAILLEVPFETIDAGYAASLHRALAPGGRLILLDSGSPSDASQRAIAILLSESGLVMDEPPARAETGYVLVARRDVYALRPYREGDDSLIAALFRATFHLDRAEAHWRWKYHESPFGNDFIALAAVPDGDLVAHYGGYPVPVWISDRDREPLLALQMGDTMTHPGFRHLGRGATSLLARTVRYFFVLHRPGPFAFFYGFNTGAIQRFSQWFIGGYEVEDVHHVERGGQAGDRSHAGYDVAEITFPQSGPALDELFARVAPDYGFLVKRDATYLEWRYRTRPDQNFLFLGAYRRGSLVGWSVFSARDGSLIWGDALFDRRHVDAARSLLATAFERIPSERVVGWFPPRPDWWDQTLAELGFTRSPEPQGLKLMVLADAIAPERLNELYYAKGDSDLF